MCLKEDSYWGGWWYWERVPALPLLGLRSKPQCSSVHTLTVLKSHVSQRLFLGTWDISHTRCSEQRKNAMKKKMFCGQMSLKHTAYYISVDTQFILVFFFLAVLGRTGGTWDIVP